MLNQKQKLPLIQVPGTDMVDTTATHQIRWILRRISIQIRRLLRPWILLRLGCEITSSIAIPSQDIQHCLTYNFKQYFKTYQSNVLIQQFKL